MIPFTSKISAYQYLALNINDFYYDQFKFNSLISELEDLNYDNIYRELLFQANKTDKDLKVLAQMKLFKEYNKKVA